MLWLTRLQANITTIKEKPMKVLTEEAITHLRETFIQEHDIHAFDVFVNSLEDYFAKVKRDMDLFFASVDEN